MWCGLPGPVYKMSAVHVTRPEEAWNYSQSLHSVLPDGEFSLLPTFPWTDLGRIFPTTPQLTVDFQKLKCKTSNQQGCSWSYCGTGKSQLGKNKAQLTFERIFKYQGYIEVIFKEEFFNERGSFFFFFNQKHFFSSVQKHSSRKSAYQNMRFLVIYFKQVKRMSALSNRGL